MLMYQHCAQQIEQIHSMMFTVKYCQRSGLQQLINGLWMLGLALVVPQDTIRAEVA